MFIINSLKLDIDQAANWIQAVGSVYSIITSFVVFVLQGWYKEYREQECHKNNIRIFIKSCYMIKEKLTGLSSNLNDCVAGNGNRVAVLSDLLSSIFNSEFRAVNKMLARDAILSTRGLNRSFKDVHNIIYIEQIYSLIYSYVDNLKEHAYTPIKDFDEYLEEANRFRMLIDNNHKIIEELLNQISK